MSEKELGYHLPGVVTACVLGGARKSERRDERDYRAGCDTVECVGILVTFTPGNLSISTIRQTAINISPQRVGVVNRTHR